MAVPQYFKAAVVHEPKAQNVISNRSLAPLGPGEVAIKITVTAINPVDWKMRDYNKFISEYPAVLGSDAAGSVAAVGPDVTGFAYCKMPAALISKTPNNVSDDHAASISLALMVDAVAFYDKKGRGLTVPWEKGGEQAGAGRAVVIIGGASSVGQYAIQLAKFSGFERIITNASATNFDTLKRLGAHVVLDRKNSGPEDFKAAIGDVPLDFVFDAISTKATQCMAVHIVQATKAEDCPVVTVHVMSIQQRSTQMLSL